MAFYSFIVISPEEVFLPELGKAPYRVHLDPGRSVFNARVEDIDEFTAMLEERGVRILQRNSLDEFEPLGPKA
jgi:hypothetical protein